MSIQRLRSHFLCTLLSMTLFGAAARAAEEATDATSDEGDRLAARLSSDDFAERRKAADGLVRLGAAGIDAVARAARAGDRETALHCLDVLGRLQKSDDESARNKAADALKSLAESQDAAIAQRARGLLDKPEGGGALQQPNVAVQGFPVQIQIVQGNAQAFGLGGGNQRQIAVTNVNGQRTIKAVENGKTVEITDRDGKDIAMKVVEEVDGQKKTTEYKAADLDELKKKHADAAKLYEQYTQQAPGIQLQAVFNAGPGLALPAPGKDGRVQAHRSIERALDELQQVRKQLEQLRAKDDADKDTLDQLVQKLDSAEKSLFEAQARLEK